MCAAGEEQEGKKKGEQQVASALVQLPPASAHPAFPPHSLPADSGPAYIPAS